MALTRFRAILLHYATACLPTLCANKSRQMCCDDVILSSKDSRKFWQPIKRMRNTKATEYANTVASVSGASDIAVLWRNR